MRFSFPLQALLNWKQSLEESSQMRLAALLTRLKQQEEEIERLTMKRLFHEEALRQKSRRGIQGGEYILYQQFLDESRRDLLSKEDRKRGTLREVDKERETLMKLTKEKKILERLKEKKWEVFKAQMEKNEQKQNDELATMKYGPHQSSE